MSANLTPALGTLAERACSAAGTDLDTVLSDLRDDELDERTPPAVRAGWSALDLHPTTDQQEDA